ncbi:2,4-dienoyl-CoA reductase [Acetoanaerobium noterae]|uniref:2,4-dienoyl-CoA reductase n=1 Tax=Acetoanaerobium noterae TaxID=745369 RepID=A0A1T5CZB3_9FIRM|nr:NADH:flavin oxidoreductase [Acetoanaerobium noterae]SKB64717.1 2,4-dienoyl-CoA reductase [Acetoanaerobium noterae]
MSNISLWDKSKVKSIELKNRFIRSALWMKMADEDGHINSNLIEHYISLAKGGVALIITGYAFISDEERPNPRMLGISNDSFIEEYKELTEAVHCEGSKIALQMVLGGSQNHHPDSQNMRILGPSAVKNRVTGITPVEATKDDIHEVIDKFALAAERAKKSGFDAVQIHAAHGYFLSQFLTPYYNRRTDEYGGDINNRARIIYEVIGAVREKVGEDYPIMIKLNFDDFMDKNEGLVMDDALYVFEKVDKLGVDIIEVSAVNESSGKGIGPARTGIKTLAEQSYFREQTEKVAQIVDAKVVLMGGNRSVEVMENILETSEINYFSIARPLLCETDLINKWKDNKFYSPKCISCNKCWETEPNSCIFNRR